MSKFTIKNIQLSLLILLTGLLISCSDDRGSAVKQKPFINQEEIIKVTSWGPKSTQAGKGFSIQPNGDSAIWFEFTGPANAHTLEVWFGGQRLTEIAVIPGKGGSALVPPKLFSKAQTIPVFLIYTPTGARVDLGTFEITP